MCATSSLFNLFSYLFRVSKGATPSQDFAYIASHYLVPTSFSPPLSSSVSCGHQVLPDLYPAALVNHILKAFERVSGFYHRILVLFTQLRPSNPNVIIDPNSYRTVFPDHTRVRPWDSGTLRKLRLPVPASKLLSSFRSNLPPVKIQQPILPSTTPLHSSPSLSAFKTSKHQRQWPSR